MTMAAVAIGGRIFLGESFSEALYFIDRFCFLHFLCLFIGVHRD